MTRLTKEEFISYKTSDTIFVLGSGYSINSIDSKQWDVIKKHNSIGFNWFCKHKFEPTFYLIREQANNRNRSSPDETPNILISRLNEYSNTAGIIVDVSKHSPHSYNYSKDENLKLPCVVLRDNKSNKSIKSIVRNIHRDPFSKTGIIHGSCTPISVTHLMHFLGYQRIVFVGIDLYDSRYFWLNKNETRHTVKKKEMNFRDEHSVAKSLINFISAYRKFSNEMYTTNPKSRLSQVIPVKQIMDFK